MGITFKETRIGRIPNGWDVVELGDRRYSKLLTGGTPSTKELEYCFNYLRLYILWLPVWNLDLEDKLFASPLMESF